MMTPNIQDNSGIVFDAKSGISEEEQREILAKINNIAEKNRLSLSEGDEKRKKKRFKAKKSGRVFPVIVNIIAFAALAGGLAVLIFTQGKTDARIRTGSKVYNSAERALIEEIRKETQNEAANELERLNREHSQAAAFEAQMGGFFANLNRQITNNNTDEAGAIIKTMREFINTPAFGTNRSIQTRKEMYTQAINSFETMLGKSQTGRNSGAGGSAINGDRNADTGGLQARITQLEQNLAEKDKTIAAFSSQGTSATRRLTELEKTNNTLQTDNRRLDRTNNTLQADNKQLTADLAKQTQLAASLQQNVDQMTPRLQKAESDLQTEKTETARLNQLVSRRDATIANRNDVITRIRGEVELDRAYDDIPPSEIKERITRIQAALRSLQ
jgi:hypothetical protein